MQHRKVVYTAVSTAKKSPSVVGEDQSPWDLPQVKITPEMEQKAMRYIAAHAADVDEARYLLMSLGLIPTPDGAPCGTVGDR